ncbi:sterol-sensing domain of SREBP cleavage-activation-domain-containing protein [Gloeopeniophorella convolvens]|nr:sterol-sensing domain of SREBP cleavage-activation-domain-containing protein [Gloeopeniophorella convolvens]
MDTLGPRLLLRLRATGHKFFHRFGLHCATHQIRVILISAVVITSLFYPALAIYSSSQPRFLAHFSSQILDPFLAADAISSYDAQRHLRDLWAVHDTLHVREDSVVRARCGVEQTLRVERVLVHSSASADSAALTPELLRATLRLERRIADTLEEHHVSCLRRPDGQCLVVSPLMFWHHNEDALVADANVLHALRPSNNVTFAGMPIQPQMVLAWRDTSEYTSADTDSTVFLALTYFFLERDCLGKSGHSEWRQLLDEATKDHADLITETQQPRLIALEYTHSSSTDTSVLTVFIYAAYLGFAINFVQSVRKSLPVHNGIGLIFTGAIEVLVSTITSLSVCALVGFRVTMIPWGIFPLIIMFIGSENMFSLVEAVVRTSITLPVKERIAEGLSRAGTSNSLKVLTYNIILGVIAFFARGAIRQFCTFAVVVLVAHWFLVHTFFVAVLSIDLQRLELEELLQQNVTPSAQSVMPRQISQSNERGLKIMTTLRGHLRGRATKNISLLLLLATTATLYFVTYPATPLSDTVVPTSIPLALQRKQDLLFGAGDPAWHTWVMLNPAKDPLVHLRIEAPSLLMFHPADAAQSTSIPPASNRTRSILSYSWIVRTATSMTRIVVLPIALTVGALYALLLYLLKDAERLEAQRYRAEAEPAPQSSDPPAAPLTFTALPRAHATDIELLAVSADGRTVAGVGLENELVVWSGGCAVPITLRAVDVLGAGPSSSNAAITALTLDDAGSFCAVGTGAGLVAVWALPAPVGGRPQRVLRGASAAVIGLHFMNARASGRSTPTSFAHFDQTPTIFATYENGAVVQWDGAKQDSPALVSPPKGKRVLWSTVLRVQDTSRLVAAFALDDGSVDVVDLVHDMDPPLPSDCHLQAGNPADTVARVHAGVVELGGSRTLVIAAATEAGIISLWDGATGACMSLLDDAYGSLGAISLCSVPPTPCTHCGALPPDGFALALTAGPTVQFLRAFLPADVTSPSASSTPRCTCTHNTPPTPEAPPWSSALGRRSRSTSTASTAPVPPPRSRHPSVSAPDDGAAFPISGHGVLSRRTSEKDFVRRTGMDTLLVPEATDAPLGPADTPHVPLRWRSLVLAGAADTTCERGAWAVQGRRIVGVRRRARRPPAPATDAMPAQARERGLSAASLERWEAWTFDPAEARVSASPLAALEPGAPAAAGRETPRLPFTRVAPLVGAPGGCVAGFGNTAGVLRLAAGADGHASCAAVASGLGLGEQMM